MNKKNYPQVVIIKKSLVAIVALFLLIIVTIVIYNLTHAFKQTENISAERIEAVASKNDTKWYENEPSQKIMDKELPQAQFIKPVYIEPKSVVHQIEKSEQITAEVDQELIRAMSAPINSNQLIAQDQVIYPTEQKLEANQIENPDQNNQSNKKAFIKENSHVEEDYLASTLHNPISPYELQAGTSIPGVLMTGINSDLPGQITGQVSSNVYDSISGKHVLIPQGAKLIGLYDSQIVYGQVRVLVVWKRVIYPNGQSLNLEGMPGVDLSGYSGLRDKVNNHYMKIFSSVTLLSILGAGAQLSQPNTNNNNPFTTPTIGQTVAQSLGTQLAEIGTEMTRKNLNIQPTIEIRPGAKFNISVTKDIVFKKPYQG